VTDTTLPEAAIAYARTQVGVHEQPKGSNSGPEVDSYLAYVKAPPGDAWCAAFVSYCVHQADVDTTSTLVPSAGALRLYFRNPPLALKRPEPNCIGIIDHGHGLGHAFFIDQVDGDTCTTIEGNTDHLGGREGFEVAERERATRSITYFLRIA
jgi:hypothetical protein